MGKVGVDLGWINHYKCMETICTSTSIPLTHRFLDANEIAGNAANRQTKPVLLNRGSRRQVGNWRCEEPVERET